MHKRHLEIQTDGRMSHGRWESSIASIDDLIKQREDLTNTRVSEMIVMMIERDRQADERF